jgi:hypothetical protein
MGHVLFKRLVNASRLVDGFGDNGFVLLNLRQSPVKRLTIEVVLPLSFFEREFKMPAFAPGIFEGLTNLAKFDPGGGELLLRHVGFILRLLQRDMGFGQRDFLSRELIAEILKARHQFLALDVEVAQADIKFLALTGQRGLLTRDTRKIVGQPLQLVLRFDKPMPGIAQLLIERLLALLGLGRLVKQRLERGVARLDPVPAVSTKHPCRQTSRTA